jgi:hypothetical protein
MTAVPMNELDRSRYPHRMLIGSRDRTRGYLARFWLLGTDVSRLAVMLHNMLNADDDTCHHDHPWWFITLVIWGGYIEEITDADGRVRTRRNRPGMILFRPAHHTHRIVALPKGNCWTLVLRGRKSRSWGFHTTGGWIGHRTFIDTRGAIDWCGGWVNKTKRIKWRSGE